MSTADRNQKMKLYPDISGVCCKMVSNPNMGGNEIYISHNMIIYIDKPGTIKIGDHIRAVRNDSGFYQELYVNGNKTDLVKL